MNSPARRFALTSLVAPRPVRRSPPAPAQVSLTTLGESSSTRTSTRWQLRTRRTLTTGRVEPRSSLTRPADGDQLTAVHIGESTSTTAASSRATSSPASSHRRQLPAREPIIVVGRGTPVRTATPRTNPADGACEHPPHAASGGSQQHGQRRHGARRTARLSVPRRHARHDTDNATLSATDSRVDFIDAGRHGSARQRLDGNAAANRSGAVLTRNLTGLRRRRAGRRSGSAGRHERPGSRTTDSASTTSRSALRAPAPATPTLSINDVTVTEGNSGTVTAAFTVSLSAPAGAGGVTFDIATADNTATTANNDYVAQRLTGQTIAAGQHAPTPSTSPSTATRRPSRTRRSS